MKNSKKIEFNLPEGFSVPDDVSENGQFQALATIQLKDGGKACLVAIDDYRMPGYQEKDGNESEMNEDKRSYSEAASADME